MQCVLTGVRQATKRGKMRQRTDVQDLGRDPHGGTRRENVRGTAVEGGGGGGGGGASCGQTSQANDPSAHAATTLMTARARRLTVPFSTCGVVEE